MNVFEKFLLAETGAFVPGLVVAAAGQFIQAFGLPDLEVFNALDQDYMSQEFILKGEFSMKVVPPLMALGGFLLLVGYLWHHNTGKSLSERHDDH